MTLIESVTLGVLQGLGEFLPISSSGHLIVVPWLLGWADHGLTFDVALHGGTLLAVLAAFAGDWWNMAASMLRGLRRGRPFDEPGGRLLGLLALASVPAAIAGGLLDHWAEDHLRSPVLVASTMAVLGGILFLADRRARPSGEESAVTLPHALLIGAAQALALVPGVSRSGATISMALLLGYPREESARFSFLLATPITFGAVLLKTRHLAGAGHLSLTLAGMAAAAIVGLLSIRVLLAYVRTRNYRPFVYYRLAFAAAVFAVFWLRSAH